MKITIGLPLLTLFFAIVTGEAAAQRLTLESTATLATADSAPLESGPLFIENKGQWDRQVKYMLRLSGMNVWITGHGVVYDLYKTDAKPGDFQQVTSGRIAPNAVDSRAPALTRTGHVVRMSFDGCSFAPSAIGTGKQQGYFNYFLGGDSTKWASNVNRYSGARLENLYNGIDAVFYLDGGRPRYDVVVRPNADLSQVRMTVEGADNLSVAADGALQIGTSIGIVEQRELHAYQMIGGARRHVACKFVIDGNSGVRFDVSSYDKRLPLIVDPLVYSTNIGGTDTDVGFAIAVDGNGNSFITGYTHGSGSAATDFPVTSGAYQTTHRSGLGNGDVFVTKLNANGTALLYSTFIGGTNGNFGRGIVIDGQSNVYITGSTHDAGSAANNYPVTSGAYQTSFRGGNFDAFVTKLNATGTALVYSTFIGGTSDDEGDGIAIDGTGRAYVTGYTVDGGSAANNFPVTSGVVQSSNRGLEDAFVAKLNSTGTALIYSTLLGGTNEDYGTGIATGANGSAYIVGRTRDAGSAANNFPTTSGAYQTSNRGFFDVFVARLDSLASTLLYSTLIGGTSDDYGNAISVTASGNAYVTGYTTDAGSPGANYPSTNAAFQTTNGGSIDAFATELDSTGSTLLYSTFLGGSSDEVGNAIAVDGAGRAFVTGYTGSSNYPVTAGSYQTAIRGGLDVFLAKLSASGSTLLYSTFIGGTSTDIGYGVALDVSGNAYLTGYNTDSHLASNNYPTTVGAYQTTIRGGHDVFVTKLSFQSDGTLPVELAEFNATTDNRQVFLTWRTASEVRNAGFEVQRAGLDSVFQAIGSYLTFPALAGLGTTSQGKYYDFADADVVAASTYLYRLVDISLDGKRTEHPPIVVSLATAEEANASSFRLSPVVPSPAVDRIMLSFSLPEDRPVTIEVLGMDGKRIATAFEGKEYASGPHSVLISLTGLPSGSYIARMTAGAGVRSERFVVVK